MRRTFIAAAATAALALVAGGIALTSGTDAVHAQDRSTQDADLAPEIQITDWINGDGRTQLADYRGEVVLLEFWNTH